MTRRTLFRMLDAVDKSHYGSIVMQTVARLASYVESDVTIFSAVRPTTLRTPESEEARTIRAFHEKLTREYSPPEGPVS